MSTTATFDAIAPANPAGKPPISRTRWLGSLSQALDLSEGLPAGHCQRACWIAMHIGQRMALNSQQRLDLYYATLLKDIGCSSNAGRLFEIYSADDLQLKSDFRTVDTQSMLQMLRYVAAHIAPFAPVRRRLARLISIIRHGRSLQRELIIERCERGAALVERMGFGHTIAGAIASLDEHWNGRGYPHHLSATEIPLLSRIALTAQIAEVFHCAGGPAAATRQICLRSGKMLDPGVVRAFLSVSADAGFWEELGSPELQESLQELFPVEHDQPTDPAFMDRCIAVFADVVDAKSSSLDGHSTRVAQVARDIAEQMEIPADVTLWIYRAALLHDLGKLGVSNAVLDKPYPWDQADMLAYRRHVELAVDVLSGIPLLAPMVPFIAMHHERLDGHGFPKQLRADAINIGARIIAVADVFDHRSRQQSAPALRIAQMLANDSGLDQNAVAALITIMEKTQT
jgi:HD-GYP domain-containing protein (c-di-GMP phosphodiesterase class II)